MCDEWMSTIELPLTVEDFRKLPRHPAYKYEYLNRRACLVPRAKFYHAMLDLNGSQIDGGTPRNVTTRLIEDGDIPNLEMVFAAAFAAYLPFAALEASRRAQAAQDALLKVRTGGEGPWIRKTSFLAVAQENKLAGAIFITLLPEEDPSGWDSFRWREPPPPDAIDRRLGRPHITWIFVSPMHAGLGIGTALLAASTLELRRMGFMRLASTFMLGNESSMLWHWRNGFRLQAYPGSRRLPIFQFPPARKMV
jgi:GNAT superfamily N-acetyltransferase